MNSISWFLYLASFCDRLNGISGFWGILLSIGIIICTVAWFITSMIAIDDKDAGKTLPVIIVLWWWIFGPLVFMGITYTVIPDSKTMYAIAASQVGEQVVKSETMQGLAGDAGKALQAWIKEQLKTEKKKD